MSLSTPPVLHQLFYISRSLADADAIEPILAGARQYNRRHGVSGALLFTGGHFAQLLEGTLPALQQTMARIEGDPRHEALRRLLEGRIAERRYRDWDMAFLSAPGADDLLQHLLLEPLIAPERAQRLLLQLLAANPRPAAGAP